jgi:hypothetical protein
MIFISAGWVESRRHKDNASLDMQIFAHLFTSFIRLPIGSNGHLLNGSSAHSLIGFNAHLLDGSIAHRTIPLDSCLITRYHFYEKRVGETLLSIRCRQISNQIPKVNISAITFSMLLHKQY